MAAFAVFLDEALDKKMTILRLHSAKQPLAQHLLLAGFMAVAAFGFTVRGSATAITIVLTLLALASLKNPEVRQTLSFAWREYRSWIIALSILPVLIAFREIFAAIPRPRYIDSASRQLLAIPLFLLATQVSYPLLQKIRWAWLAAVVLMLAVGLHYGASRIQTEFTNTIPYAAFSLIFGTLLWISCQGLQRKYQIWCWVGIACCATIVYLSASRGVWAAVPLAIFCGLKNRPETSLRQLAIIGATLIASAIVLYGISPAIQERVAISLLDFKAYLNGNKDLSSIGMRLQLAVASWYILLDHPWFGVGRDILPALADLHAKGLITTSVATAVDTHGELFFNSASLGIPGVFATLFFYIGGTKPFWIARKSDNPEISKIGRMGVSCNAILFVTGFSHITLGLAMYASIYAATQAVLLAWLLKVQQLNTTRQP